MLGSFLAFIIKPDTIRSLLYMIGGGTGIEISQDSATQVVSGIVALSGLIHGLEQIVRAIKDKRK